MAGPPLIDHLSRPKPEPRRIGCITCGAIVLIILLMFVGGIVALCSAEHRQEQGALRQAAELMQKPCDQVVIHSPRSAKPGLKLNGSDARLLGAIVQKEFERETEASNAFNSWNTHLVAKYELSDGSALRVEYETAYAYYLESSHEWYLGSSHYSFLLTLIWVTLNLESGLTDDQFDPDTTSMKDLYRRLDIPPHEPWRGLTPEEVEFVKSWMARFNAVSGLPAMDAERLLRSR